MRTRQSVLDAYENGDLNRRLCLFLEHRSLRDQFMTIEMKAPGTTESCRQAAVNDRNRSAFGRTLDWIRSLLPACGGCAAEHESR